MTSEQQSNVLVREKLAQVRHNETISEMGAFLGLFILVLTFFISPSTSGSIGLLLFIGLALMFTGAASAFYYDRKQQKLLKQLVPREQ
jgi:VIT1/CCC1 family predicted Fe2+/Mn2+ transporter